MRTRTAVLAAAIVLVGLVAHAAESENMLGNPTFGPPYPGGVPQVWHLSKQSADGEAAVAVIEVDPPAGSAPAGATGEPKPIKAVQLEMKNMEWVYLGQNIIMGEPIPAGKTYAFSVWMRAEKPVKVSVINTVITTKKNEEGKLVSQHKWGGKNVTTKWKKYTTEITVDDKAPYQRFWPRVQLYASGVNLDVALPEYVEVVK